MRVWEIANRTRHDSKTVMRVLADVFGFRTRSASTLVRDEYVYEMCCALLNGGRMSRIPAELYGY